MKAETAKTKVNFNNQVTLLGEVIDDITLNHEFKGTKYYRFSLKVVRSSGTYDVIPVLFSEAFMEIIKNNVGKNIRVSGMYNSYNLHDEETNTNKLALNVSAKAVEEVDGEAEDSENNNSIMLQGFVCKKPNYRKTPLGKEITDLILAVNRNSSLSDYIPCILWGGAARYAEKFESGQKCIIYGRIQSREYTKKISETEVEKRLAYEVSVGKLIKVSNDTDDKETETTSEVADTNVAEE